MIIENKANSDDGSYKLPVDSDNVLFIISR